MSKIVGFTGTREGMTPPQLSAVSNFLTKFDVLHHGDCMGADIQTHEVAVLLGMEIHVHPPTSTRFRAFAIEGIRHTPKDYLSRNRDITLESKCLIAAPHSMQEEMRGGTWYTVRYARALKRPIAIIWPDGTIKREGGFDL